MSVRQVRGGGGGGGGGEGRMEGGKKRGRDGVAGWKAERGGERV